MTGFERQTPREQPGGHYMHHPARVVVYFVLANDPLAVLGRLVGQSTGVGPLAVIR